MKQVGFDVGVVVLVAVLAFIAWGYIYVAWLQ